MQSLDLSADQIRNRCGCTFAEAQAACYMASAANSGWSLATFCERTSCPAIEARDRAFRFGLVFEDYNPLSEPTALVWRKAKTGWELFVDGSKKCAGTCERLGTGKYKATAFGLSVEAWRSRDAMAQLSAQLDTQSRNLFKRSSVEARIIGEGLIFPDYEDKELSAFRSALEMKVAA